MVAWVDGHDRGHEDDRARDRVHARGAIRGRASPLFYELRRGSAAPGNCSLLGSMTTHTRDFVDAPSHDCHYQKWLGTRSKEESKTGAPGCSAGGDDQSYRQIEFLGCSGFHADRRSGNVALRREYTVPGIDRA